MFFFKFNFLKSLFQNTASSVKDSRLDISQKSKATVMLINNSIKVVDNS